MRSTLTLRASALALLLWATLGFAQGSHRVVFLRAPSQATDATASLVQTELRAAGFQVDLEDSEGDVSRAALADATSRPENVAALTTRTDDEGLVAVVFLTDRELKEQVEREVRVPFGGEEGARLLALRVVELLHASSLEVAVDVPGPSLAPVVAEQPADATPESATAVESPPGDAPARAAEEAPSRWAVAVGPTVSGGPGGLPISIGPLALLSYQVAPRWAAEALIAGPAVGGVDDAVGTAVVDQEMAALRVRVATEDHPVAPHVAIGAGAYRVGARGNAAEPLRGVTRSQLTFMTTLAVGARWKLRRHLSALAELSGAVVAPRPVLHFDGRSGAAVAAPLVSGTVAMELSW